MFVRSNVSLKCLKCYSVNVEVLTPMQSSYSCADSMQTLIVTGSAEYHPPAFAMNVTSLPNGQVIPERGGKPNIISIDACNDVCISF